jgi:tetratricopeptide (TPR) repeat protein
LIADICQRRGAVQPVQKARTIGKSTLFPQGHGDYRFPDLPEPLPDGVVFQAKETCPICGVSFQNTMLLESKLVRRQMDPDLREHYKGIEPMHYEVYTCPQCWYSALKDQFPQAEPAQPAHLLGELVTFHTELALEFDEFRDAAAVFTSYYLALHCAPRCFVNAELQIGKLWTRLAWLYTDCGDEKMTEYAHKRALEAYEIAFQHVDLSPRGLQRLYFIQGDLLYKLQRFAEAKDKFFKAKTHRGGTEMIRNYAEDRLELIRKVEKQA